MLITSMQNDQIKQIKKLQKAKERKKKQQFLIEGIHLVEEAHESGWPIEQLLIAEGFSLPDWLQGYAYQQVSNNVFAQISETKTPQGVLAVLKMQPLRFPEAAKRLLICDSVQDPGNLGTMIRTADAAGFDAVLCSDGTVDMYNDKTIRSTQGSLFHIPVISVDLQETLSKMKEMGFHIWAAALRNSVSYDQAQKADKLAIVVGNEGAGIQETVIEQADEVVKIPIFGKAESLNVSVAAGILMYEAKK